MKELIRKQVEMSVMDFIRGEDHVTKINNVYLCWHGEFGPLSEGFVNIVKTQKDGKVYEGGESFVVDLEEYVTKYHYKRWYNDLVNDITDLVMEMTDPDAVMSMDNLLKDMSRQVNKITKTN